MSAPRSLPPTGSPSAPATGRCTIFMPGGEAGRGIVTLRCFYFEIGEILETRGQQFQWLSGWRSAQNGLHFANVAMPSRRPLRRGNIGSSLSVLPKVTHGPWGQNDPH